MDEKTSEWESWDELLTWACWHVMDAITRGRALRSAVNDVLTVTRSAKFKDKEKP